MSPYNKPKDKLLAHATTLLGFVLVPLMVLLHLITSMKDVIVDTRRDLRREFKGGLRVTYRYAYGELLAGMARKRAYRARKRLSTSP